MEALVERCAGLDVHRASVVCRALVGGPPGDEPQKLLRTFGTTTHEPRTPRSWLAGQGVTHVGMESTGIHRKPVHAALEGHFDLTVGNAHHNQVGELTCPAGDLADVCLKLAWRVRLGHHVLPDNGTYGDLSP